MTRAERQYGTVGVVDEHRPVGAPRLHSTVSPDGEDERGRRHPTRKANAFAAVDLPGIPAGTKGKVTRRRGSTWIRYWVRFDNGVIRGSMNRKHLARPTEWGVPSTAQPSAPGDDELGGEPGRS